MSPMDASAWSIVTPPPIRLHVINLTEQPLSYDGEAHGG